MMKKTLLVALVLGVSLAVVSGQDDKAQLERSAHQPGSTVMARGAEPSPSPATASRGDLIYTVDVGALTGEILCAGVDFDETMNMWWVTGGQGPWNLFLIDYAGTTFTAYPNGTTWYSPIDICMADNGDVYAAPYDWEGYDNEVNLYTMGVYQAHIAEVTFYSPTAQAYYAGTDDFFVAEAWSGPIHILDNGPYPGTPDTPVADTLVLDKAGFAIDGDTMWIFAQNGPGLADVYAWDVNAQDYTGDVWSADATLGIAGGACIMQDPTYGKVFACVQQGDATDVVAVYYAGLSPYPTVDVKVNGSDGGVVIPEGDNAVATIDVDARDYAGFPVDIWVMARNVDNGNMFTYGDYGDPMWLPGLCNVYFTGGLFSLSETVLDMPLPLGNYEVYLALDIYPNGQINLPFIYVYDVADFEVLSLSGFFEDFDDGMADNWVPDSANWFVQSGVYYLDTPSFQQWLSYYDFGNYGDFTYSADIRMVDTGNTAGNYWYGLYFRSDSTLSNCYTLYAGYSGSVYLYKYVGGSGTLLWSDTPAAFVTGVGNWNNFKVVCNGSTIDAYINDTLVASVVDTEFSTGYVGLRGEGSGTYDHEYEYDNATLTF